MNDQGNPSDPDDSDWNDSGNVAFDTVLKTFMSRRGLLKVGARSALALMVQASLPGCGDGEASSPSPAQEPKPTILQLNFAPVASIEADLLRVPAGYSSAVLYALGDPISSAVPEYSNLGLESGASFTQRAGDHHDGMEYFGLAPNGRHDPESSERGLLCVNHENVTSTYLHTAGASPLPRPADEVLKEMNAHGVSIIEVRRSAGLAVTVVRDSPFNRRITALTEMELTGAAAGSPWVRTMGSPSGLRCRGTVNNCATGRTPWGTFLTCEENWHSYFGRDPGDNLSRGGDASRAARSLQRYGLLQGLRGTCQWSTAVAEDPSDQRFKCWDATARGAASDGSADFRNAPFTFGYVVEIDPFDMSSMPRKRTALGRMCHESAAHARPVAGQPIVFYMGDDSQGEYVYKYVSREPWSSADADSGGAAAGDKYLNAGTLYAAKFNADGTGQWLPLTLDNPAIAGSSFGFSDPGDICVHTRLAADAAGATRMDRSEWTAVSPMTGEVYVALTGNNSRSFDRVDAANPRSNGAGNGGNLYGHILRLREYGAQHSATEFQWDIYLFGSPPAEDGNVNISGLTETNSFVNPDGVWFDRRGVCWIQDDASRATMLAGIPGKVGDGAARQVLNATANGNSSVTTYVSAPDSSSPANLRRFMVGPPGSTITGVAMTPDMKTMFVNIQHPGAGGSLAKLESSWPASDSVSRPRSATVVVTRVDGSTIGSHLV